MARLEDIHPPQATAQTRCNPRERDFVPTMQERDLQFFSNAAVALSPVVARAINPQSEPGIVNISTHRKRRFSNGNKHHGAFIILLLSLA